MTDFVLVQGAWHGAWCWQRVLPGLWRAGHRAFPVSLTGVGERAHQLAPTVTLDTHIADVLAVIAAEELHGAVLVGDYLYGTDIAGSQLIAAEFTTGKVKWKAESIGRVSMVYADGLLYLHGLNGDIALIEATPEAYREKARFTPPDQPRHKQVGTYPEQAYAHPVIANGRLYIRDLGTLWVYDIKGR